MAPSLMLALLLQVSAATHGIEGIVLDTSGAPIAGATVRYAGGSSSGTAVTDADGTFRLPSIPVNASVTVSADGFAESTVRLRTEPAGRIRVVLQPRGISESIDVSANPERLRLSTPASATVVDAESLARAAAWTIDDQLRSVPGFSLFRRSSSRVANPTTQGVTLRGLAASGASRTVVTVDGVALNDPFGGWVYWDRIPAAAIERIEVARGGSSDLHGSDALGGAIRIVTRSGAGARVWADAGSQNSVRGSAYAGGTLSGFDVFGAIEGGGTDGFVVVAPESRGPIDIRADSDYASAFAGFGAPVATSSRVELRGGYFSEDRGNGTPFQTNGTIVRHLAARSTGAAFGGLWSVRGSTASQDYDQTFSAVSADRASERPTSVQHVDTSSGAIAGEWLRGGERNGLLLSADFRHLAGDLLEGAPGAALALTPARQQTVAGAAQLTFQLHDRVTASGGLRAELWNTGRRDRGDSTSFGSLLPRASVAVRASEMLSFRGAIHQAYRAPTVNELYRSFRVGNVLTRANSTLGPETSTGVEGAVLYRKGRTAGRAVAFWTRLSDSVVNVTLESGATILRERQNAGRIRAAGVELEADLRIQGPFTVTGSLAYIDSVFTDGADLDGLRVPQVPRWQGAASVQGVWPRAVASVDWRFIGRQFDDDRNQFLLDRSSMVNARAAWRVEPALEAFVALENAFDFEQDVGRTPLRTTGLPRTVRVGIRWTK